MKKNTMKTKRQSVAASRRRKKIDRVSEAAVVSTILVPVDFSIQSSKALHYACTLAKAFGARLHLLHVNEAVVDAPALASAFFPSRERNYFGGSTISPRIFRCRVADCAVTSAPAELSTKSARRRASFRPI